MSNKCLASCAPIIVLTAPAGQIANLSDANLVNASLKEANLFGVQLEGAHIDGANFENTFLTQHQIDDECGPPRVLPQDLKAPKRVSYEQTIMEPE